MARMRARKSTRTLKSSGRCEKGPATRIDEEPAIFAVGPVGPLKSGSWKVSVKFFNPVLSALLDLSRAVVWCQCGLRQCLHLYQCLDAEQTVVCCEGFLSGNKSRIHHAIWNDLLQIILDVRFITLAKEAIVAEALILIFI